MNSSNPNCNLLDQGLHFLYVGVFSPFDRGSKGENKTN